MGRYLDSKCKLCRREGRKLYLKGERCYSQKCPLTKRKYPPGVHGPKGYPKLSDYGAQLREKQRTKRMYAVLERQFKKYFHEAERLPGDTGENFLRLLEMRLDNVLYRAGFAVSRNAARQLVSHGHMLVNERPVKIPSYRVKVGQTLQLKKTSRLRPRLEEEIKKRPEVPGWLSLDIKNMSCKMTASPKIEDLPQDVDTRLIVEFYRR